jgi:hypothetical protein
MEGGNSTFGDLVIWFDPVQAFQSQSGSLVDRWGLKNANTPSERSERGDEFFALRPFGGAAPRGVAAPVGVAGWGLLWGTFIVAVLAVIILWIGRTVRRS